MLRRWNCAYGRFRKKLKELIYKDDKENKNKELIINYKMTECKQKGQPKN